jgi:hypothetical protein
MNPTPVSQYGRKRGDEEKRRPRKEERKWQEYGKGYDRLAAFMANDPDKSTTIYRKFERLSAYNLLLMETEIASLEERLDRLEDDIQAEMEASRRLPAAEQTERIGDLQALGQNWEFLQMCAHEEAPADINNDIIDMARRKMELTLDLRSRLTEYCKSAPLCWTLLDGEMERKSLHTHQMRPLSCQVIS